MSEVTIVLTGQSAHYPFRAALSGFRSDMAGTAKVLLRTSDLAEAVALFLSYEQMSFVLPQPAAMSFDEFLLSLVLAQHPHSYSDDLRSLSRAAAPRIVREAEHWMRTGGPETSVALGNGIFHLARFSAYYKTAFDETPGQTLHRSRLRGKLQSA